MTLMLPLSPELEERLSYESSKLGIEPADYAIQVLNEHVPAGDGGEAISLLQSWIDQGDVDEQRETGDYLIQALDEDRAGARKLFPPELQGVTW